MEEAEEEELPEPVDEAEKELPEPVSEEEVMPKQDTVKPYEPAYEPLVIPTPILSPAVLYWSRYAGAYDVFGPEVTFRDTLIVNPLFMPPVFKEGHVLPIDTITVYQPADTTLKGWEKPLYPQRKWFEKELLKMQIEELAYRYLQRNRIDYFRYSVKNLPNETIHFIRKEETVAVPVEQKGPNPMDYTPPTKFIPDRKYWSSTFQSDLKFTQNYISPNWAGGGVSNMNILAKNLLQYNYIKDKMIFNNTMEINASMYNAPKDTLRDYKIGSDLFRYYGSFGYRAFNKWYYSINVEFFTQMFTNFQENTTVKQAALLAPFTVKIEPGMVFNLAKTYPPRKDRSLNVALTVSPFSYKYMYSIDRTIDLGRHGFQKDENEEFERQFSEFGSTLRYDMTLRPNRNVAWTSNFNYFTSYTHVKAEFVNALNLAISRYFSTLITLHLRYDDGVAKTSDYDSYIQSNETLSFGFLYRW
ncbi:MAG: DUF3078 domain-containing protein [Tannerella sp.]|nr:DUF3078 domain-containing protein [Tannerella sp.]